MKLMLVQAQILGISAPVLRWPIRHHRVQAFVGRKPATVELATVLKWQDDDGQSLIECRAAAMKRPARRVWRSLT